MLDKQSARGDARIYSSLHRLQTLSALAASVSLRPCQYARCHTSGKHIAKARGRGLDFAEYRHYQAGDDIRAMDWRVTMRTKQPHIRVFSEEKELPVILMVDQRLSMFFSSQQTMKSVVAAELASLCGWSALKGGDRVGALVFNDESVNWFPPKRSHKHLLQVLAQVHLFNQALGVDKPVTRQNSSSLDLALTKLLQTKMAGSLVIILSDFKGIESKASQTLQAVLAKNEVIAVSVKDPLEVSLSPSHSACVSDGIEQVLLPSDTPALLEKYEQHNREKNEALKTRLLNQGAMFCEVSSEGEHLVHFQQAMNGGKQRGK